MKAFFRDTITGGILFLLPMVLILMLLKKAHDGLSEVVAPIANIMPDIFLGFDGSRVIAIVLMVAICFFSGLLFRSNKVKYLMRRLEDNFLYLIPGYVLMKSITSDAIGANEKPSLIPVVVEKDDGVKVAFLTEEKDGLCVVFYPEPTNSDSGELVIVPSHTVKRIDVPSNKIAQCIKRFGAGLIDYVH